MTQRIIVKEGTHSPLGASGASRWMNCPGSIPLAAKLPNGGNTASSEAADEGTAAHEIAALCLQNDQETWEYDGAVVVIEETGREFAVDQDMQEAIDVYVDYVRQVMSDLADQDLEPVLMVEVRLQHPDFEWAHGTGDVVIVHKKGIVVIDLKFGRGVGVEADTPQTKYYGAIAAVGFADSYGPRSNAELVIVQPRKPHPDGPIRTFKMSIAKLNTWWKKELVPAVEATEDLNALLKMGPHCKFCPAKRQCPALMQTALDVPTSADPKTLTDEEIGDILLNRKTVEAFYEDLATEALSRAKLGHDVKGFKLVYGNSKRSWKEKDPDKAEKALIDKFGSEAFAPKKLKTLPQIEKLPGGKKFVAEHGFSAKGALTLALDSDTKVAVSPQAAMAAGIPT